MPRVGYMTLYAVFVMKYIGLLNKRLHDHWLGVYDKQLCEIRRIYAIYTGHYQVEFTDLICDLERLEYQEAGLAKLLSADVGYVVKLRAQRQQINDRLLKRLYEADVTMLMDKDEDDLAEMVAVCNLVQDELVERAQEMRSILHGIAQHVMCGEIDLACETLRGLAYYARLSAENLKELPL